MAFGASWWPNAELSSLLDPHVCEVQKCRPFVMAFGASYPRGAETVLAFGALYLRSAELSWLLEPFGGEVQNCHLFGSLVSTQRR